MKSFRHTIIMTIGFLSLALGIVGALLPILPTAPFLILAAFCFANTNKRFHRYLVEHPQLGPPITDWEKHRVIRKKSKWLATIAILIGAGVAFAIIGPHYIFFATYGAIVPLILLFIWTKPSHPPDEAQ